MPERTRFDDGHDLCQYVKGLSGDTVLLAFSAGKDSIAAWLRLKEHFTRIVPYYMYLIPGLEFVESSLRYYEDFFQTPIARLPHPGMYRMLRNLVWQPHDRVDAILDAELPALSFRDIEDEARRLGNVPGAWLARGVRSADSSSRRIRMELAGPLSHRRRTFSPVYDVKLDGLIDMLKRVDVKLPIDYRWFGMSFDGLDYRFTSVLKREAPRDYAKILAWFPLLESDQMRRVFAARRTNAQAPAGRI